MSGYIYIIEHERMPDHVLIGKTNKPIEEVLKSKGRTFKCTHLWRVDWPHKLEKAIHEDFGMAKYHDDGNPLGGKEYFRKSVVHRLHLYIDEYLEENFSSESRELLKSTKDKRPTRADMSLEERRLDEIKRAEEASRVRREKEGILTGTFADLLNILPEKKRE